MQHSLWTRGAWLFVYVACVVLGFFITVYFFTPARQLEPVSDNSEIKTTLPPFSLEPPAQSLKGLLTQKIGTVLHKTRDTDEFIDATNSGIIRIGESIATKEKSKAIIDIPTLVAITMDEQAELVFSNIFLQNSVFLQKSGKIEYASSATYPVAIRALHALIEATQATMSVTVMDSTVHVDVTKGIAKLAIVDTDNVTHVYDIEEGISAKIDDRTRTVSLSSPRQ